MAQKVQHIEFGSWEPDDVLLSGRQAPEARNVIPNKRGYRYLPALSRLKYPVIPGGRCLEAYTIRDVNGDLLTLAASSDGKIYALEGNEWVEKLGTATVSTNRHFIMYGSSMYMIYGTSLYKSSVSGGFSTFEEVTAAPKSHVGAVIKDFLCLGDTDEGRNWIHWSAMDDPDSWPAAGSDEAAAVQSDYQIFPEGGRVQAIVGAVGAADGIIFLERAIQRASYIGSPYIFNFKTIDLVRGLLAPHSPVVYGQACVYLSDDGWYVTDGSTTKPVGLERVDRWFFSQVNTKRMDDVKGIHDPINRICIWIFPSVNAEDGLCDRILIYAYDLDKWSYGMLSMQTMWGDYSRGATLEDLDEYGAIDTLPFGSLDNSVFQTGRALIAAFDSEGYVSTMTGEPLEAIIETAEIGGQRMFVHGLRPIVDRGDAKSLPVYRDRQERQPKYGTLRAQSRDGVCYQHLSTEYLAARIVIPAGGTPWRDASGVDALIELEGGL